MTHLRGHRICWKTKTWNIVCHPLWRQHPSTKIHACKELWLDQILLSDQRCNEVSIKQQTSWHTQVMGQKRSLTSWLPPNDHRRAVRASHLMTMNPIYLIITSRQRIIWMQLALMSRSEGRRCGWNGHWHQKRRKRRRRPLQTFPSSNLA